MNYADLHTKRLLALLRQARARVSRQILTEEGTLPEVDVAAIKAELAARPHVINKKEAKAARQAKAKSR